MIATARSNKRRPQQQGMKLYPILLVIIFFWIGWSSIFAHIHLSSLDSNSGFEVTSKNATITTVSRLPPPSSSDQESSSSTVDEAKLAFRRLQSSWTSKRNSPECRVFYNYSDIQRCVAPYDRRNFTEESRSGCETIETWDDVQKCMNGDRNNQKEKPPNLVINLIGERNSGTKWMVDEMKQCFPNHKIERDYGGRSKHFFQISEYRYNAQRKRIVIAAFRDPVEWVAAM